MEEQKVAPLRFVVSKLMQFQLNFKLKTNKINLRLTNPLFSCHLQKNMICEWKRNRFPFVIVRKLSWNWSDRKNDKTEMLSFILLPDPRQRVARQWGIAAGDKHSFGSLFLLLYMINSNFHIYTYTKYLPGVGWMRFTLFSLISHLWTPCVWFIYLCI